MRKLLILGILLLCCATMLAQQQATTPPSQPFTLSVNVDLVLFNVSVLDKKGHTVFGLQKENFHIYEDGRAEEIKLFQPENIPATVGLVIDNSGSMMSKRQDVIFAAMDFAGESNPLDELFIVNFNDRVTMGLPPSIPFTSDRKELQSALMSTRSMGRTALYDGVAVALNHLKEGTSQKKALVILSDGGDNASSHRLNDVVQMAEQSSATIYAVGIYDTMDRDRNPKVLHELAKLTGGESYTPHGLKELSDVWKKVAAGIRSQYTIGFVSDNPNRDGAFRHVQVDVVDKKGKPLIARTRSGYLAPVEQHR